MQSAASSIKFVVFFWVSLLGSFVIVDGLLCLVFNFILNDEENGKDKDMQSPFMLSMIMWLSLN